MSEIDYHLITNFETVLGHVRVCDNWNVQFHALIVSMTIFLF